MTAAESVKRYSPEIRNAGQWGAELESPLQRFARLIMVHNISFERVPDRALPQILADHRTVKVIKHQIKIQLEGRTYTFFDKDSPYLCSNDAEYLAYYSGTDPEHLYLTDGEGAFKCRLPRVDKVRQGDVDAMKKALAETRHTLKKTIATINSRDSRIDKTRKAAAANEAAIAKYQELQTIAIAPDTAPGTGNITGVTSALNDSQDEVYQERRDQERELVRIRKQRGSMADIYQDEEDDSEEPDEVARPASGNLNDIYGNEDD